MKEELTAKTTPDARLEKLADALADCIREVEALSPAPEDDAEYETVATRVVDLEGEIRAVAPTASEGQRSRLRRKYTDDVGYVADLL